MSKADKNIPELVRAAEVLEDELVKLEALSRSVRKIRLDSEKNLARAMKELNQALRLPEELGAGLLALGKAMQGMQERQQAALAPLTAFATEIQRRMGQLEAHREAFAALGQAAGDVTDLLQVDGERGAVLEDARGKLGEIVESARTLFEAARADDFPELARDADALRQKLAALHKRLDAAAN
jgi:hypothetical protein